MIDIWISVIRYVCLTGQSIRLLRVAITLMLDIKRKLFNWATRGVTVSMSAFLACHQCYCAGSSLAWGLSDSVFLDYHND